MCYNPCSETPCKNKVQKCLKGGYYDKLIGKKNGERERISLEARECLRDSGDRTLDLLVGR